MASIPSTDEQNFLATLQECLQADNEKRTAAEVSIILTGDALYRDSFRRSIKIFRTNKKRFCSCRHCETSLWAHRWVWQALVDQCFQLPSFWTASSIFCRSSPTPIPNAVRELLAQVFPWSANGIEKRIAQPHHTARRRWEYSQEDLLHCCWISQKSHG